METDRNIEKVEFVPSLAVNDDIVVRLRGWLIENTDGLIKSEYYRREIERYAGGVLHLEFSDYVGNAHVGAVFHINDERLPVVEDPEGTWWTSHSINAEVSIPGYASARAPLAERRLSMYRDAVELAKRFDAEFGDVRLWARHSTKAERDAAAKAFAEAVIADTAQLKLGTAIREAIHTTCKHMRIGHDRYINAPDGVLPGTYTVEVESKTYFVDVYKNRVDRSTMHFRRTA